MISACARVRLSASPRSTSIWSARCFGIHFPAVVRLAYRQPFRTGAAKSSNQRTAYCLPDIVGIKSGASGRSAARRSSHQPCGRFCPTEYRRQPWPALRIPTALEPVDSDRARPQWFGPLALADPLGTVAPGHDASRTRHVGDAAPQRLGDQARPGDPAGALAGGARRAQPGLPRRRVVGGAGRQPYGWPVAGALLVAPADVDRDDRARRAEGLRAFARPPSFPSRRSSSRAATIRGSNLAMRDNLASAWGSHFVDAGPQGHLNATSGIGWWEEGQNCSTV